MVVTLPQVLDAGTLSALARQLEGAASHIVLEGAGEGVFCNGLALEQEPSELALTLFVRCMGAIRCGPPAIAIVDGVARGGGVGLAAACDRVIATPEARFHLTEAWFGLWPAAIWPLLSERVGSAKLRWMVAASPMLRADEALALGLADECGDGDVGDVLHGLRRSDVEAIRLMKTATAPMAAIASGAETTRRRLGEETVRRRLADFAEGLAPWT